MNYRRTILSCSLLLAVGISMFATSASASPKKSRQQTKLPSTTIPVTLYGMHITQDKDPLPPTGWFGQQRLWDSDTNWYQMEPHQSVTITAVARTNGTSTVYVTPEPQGWVAGTTVFVNLSAGSPLSSFNGLYTINKIMNGTITYLQNLGNVLTTSVAGTANNFDFSTLDQVLNYAAAPNFQVLYTFGKVPSFYSSDASGDCGSDPVGSCYRPNDLKADGTGSNQNWRLFVAGLAKHIASLEGSTIPYAIPAYFETWNEFNKEGSWHYNDSMDNTDDPKALVRLLDDAACIIKGTGTIHATTSCANDPNFVAKAVLPSAQMLTPCVNSPTDVTAWAHFYSSYSDAAANADIIGIHSYMYSDNIQGIQTIHRDGGTGKVTVTVNDTTGYLINVFVKVSGVGDRSFDGDFMVTGVTPPNTITYQQPGTDLTSSGGHIQNGPDQLQAALSAFHSGLSSTDKLKPFWVTEGSWGENGPTDVTTREGYIVRFFAILWSNGVARANWYTWSDSKAFLWESMSNTGDVACDGIGNDPKCNPPEPSSGWGYVTLAGQAHSVGEGWLVGTTMTSPCSSTGSVWTCGLQTSGSQNELMVWDSAQDRSSNTSLYTPSVAYTAYFDLSGTKHSCTPSPCTNIPIAAKPILFVND
jgi:hypothetical protein